MGSSSSLCSVAPPPPTLWRDLFGRGRGCNTRLTLPPMIIVAFSCAVLFSTTGMITTIVGKDIRIVEPTPKATAAAAEIVPLDGVDGHRGLTGHIVPANISEPSALSRLRGHCFAVREGSYEYRVCPFDNVTQCDIVASWSPFQGVLGVYTGMRVEGDRVISLLFHEGTSCGDIRRQTEVMLLCENENEVMKVIKEQGPQAIAAAKITTPVLLRNPSEPSMCSYRLELATPLACLANASISHALRTHANAEALLVDWEAADAALYDGEITQKGFEKRRQRVLARAGLATTTTTTTTIATTTITTAAPTPGASSDGNEIEKQQPQQRDQQQHGKSSSKTSTANGTSIAGTNNNRSRSSSDADCSAMIVTPSMAAALQCCDEVNLLRHQVTALRAEVIRLGGDPAAALALSGSATAASPPAAAPVVVVAAAATSAATKAPVGGASLVSQRRRKRRQRRRQQQPQNPLEEEEEGKNQ